MATTKKTKVKKTARTPRPVKTATSAYTPVESNGIIVFTLLAIIFFLVAIAEYL